MLKQLTNRIECSWRWNVSRLNLVALALIALMVMTSSAYADSITLRHSTRLSDAATSVQLSDVATLEGEYAQQFATLELAPLHPQARPIQLSVDLIRQKLSDAGAHWGKLNLTGRSVTVRPSRAQVRGTQLLAMQAVDVSTGEVKLNDDVSTGVETGPAVEIADQRLSRRSLARLQIFVTQLTDQVIKKRRLVADLSLPIVHFTC